MSENPKDADLEFFDNLTKDTLSTNGHLKKYYDTIESLYNGNSIFLSGQDAENETHEVHQVTGDDQDAQSGDYFQNNRTDIFISKFSIALEKLLYQYDDFSLLQNDHSNPCVYFKYWFYDKILKNIFYKEKLEHFYKEIQHGDEEDESESEKVEQFEEGTGELREVFLDNAEEEEEEDLVEGSSEDSEEDDTVESESQHRCKDEDCDSKKILLALGKSNSCKIYKLNLNQIRVLKLLYDYLEDYKGKNRSSIEKEISKRAYCSFFKETIELYKDKGKCKSNYSHKEFCQELEECWNNYSHTQIPTLSCNIKESASDPPQQSTDGKTLQEATSAPSPPGRGVPPLMTYRTLYLKVVKGLFPNPVDIASTTQHMSHDIGEKHALKIPEHVNTYAHPNIQIQSSRDMGGSYSPDSEASTSCQNGSVGKHCKSSLQRLSTIRTEASTKLNIGEQENTENHDETEVGLQEETGNTNTIVSSASTVLGVSALAFMLYKFTPLGSLINNRRGGINTWDINEEGYDENLLFSPALGNTNSNNNNYNIGYYSLGNT
ncbi:PIR Superfamily Protein [Plasmodium ovale curtisi]|uniref:PIR Superfamily Protein n=1 Tax=Plasmodium ovale curtisi TaxID=864141 RepID=A0A1A8X373_PLAOA|nr:PIR Superfamily Protein [Plasmodium ovale curtisi]